MLQLAPCMCMHMCMYKYTHMNVSIHIYMCVCVCVCACVCVSECVSVCESERIRGASQLATKVTIEHITRVLQCMLQCVLQWVALKSLYTTISLHNATSKLTFENFTSSLSLRSCCNSRQFVMQNGARVTIGWPCVLGDAPSFCGPGMVPRVCRSLFLSLSLSHTHTHTQFLCLSL